MRAIVRDFDDDKLAAHTALLRRTAEEVVAAAPGARLEVVVTPQYPNMRRFIEQFPQATELAERAIRAEGIEPVRTPIRGGTDGSRLSAMGLPTPNLFTGGHDVPLTAGMGVAAGDGRGGGDGGAAGGGVGSRWSATPTMTSAMPSASVADGTWVRTSRPTTVAVAGSSETISA